MSWNNLLPIAWLLRKTKKGGEKTMSDINKYKYDVLRHAIRTEFAQGNLGGKAGSRLAAAMEAVRDKSESECRNLATSYAAVRQSVRAQTGSNGETPPAA